MLIIGISDVKVWCALFFSVFVGGMLILLEKCVL